MGSFFRLRIKVNQPIDIDTEEYIFHFLALLYNNGQIEHDFSVIRQGEEYCAYVFALEKTFLDKKNCSGLVIKTLDFLSVESTYIGENIDSMDLCKCNCSKIALYYSDNINASPIKCCACGGDVPLYKLNGQNEVEDFFVFRKWKETCGAIDHIWKNSMLADDKIKALLGKGSDFYKWSEELCRTLEHVSRKEVEIELPIIEIGE